MLFKSFAEILSTKRTELRKAQSQMICLMRSLKIGMAEQNREEIIADFKKWLEEHKEQFQEHTLDALPMEDFDDDWDG